MFFCPVCVGFSVVRRVLRCRFPLRPSSRPSCLVRSVARLLLWLPFGCLFPRLCFLAWLGFCSWFCGLCSSSAFPVLVLCSAGRSLLGGVFPFLSLLRFVLRSLLPASFLPLFPVVRVSFVPCGFSFPTAFYNCVFWCGLRPHLYTPISERRKKNEQIRKISNAY